MDEATSPVPLEQKPSPGLPRNQHPSEEGVKQLKFPPGGKESREHLSHLSILTILFIPKTETLLTPIVMQVQKESATSVRTDNRHRKNTARSLEGLK